MLLERVQLDRLALHGKRAVSSLVHPLGLVAEVVIVSLVAEVHAGVAPVGCRQLRL